MGSVDTKLGIRAVGLLLAEREHEHTGDVGLEGDGQQVEHQLGMLVVRLGHTDRPVGDG